MGSYGQFHVPFTNDIRQGVVISPVLFCIYMEQYFESVRRVVVLYAALTPNMLLCLGTQLTCFWLVLAGVVSKLW